MSAKCQSRRGSTLISRSSCLLGSRHSASGLAFNFEPLLGAATPHDELFQEAVWIDQRVGLAGLARRQCVVSFRQSGCKGMGCKVDRDWLVRLLYHSAEPIKGRNK